MMIQHSEAPCGPEKDSFQGVMGLFAMGAMTFFQSPFCHGCLVAMAPIALYTPLGHAPMDFSMPRPSKWDNETAK